MGMTLSTGDFVSIKTHLMFMGNDKYNECRKVRAMRDYDTHPDIAKGTGGVVLGSLISRDIKLFVVWVNDERCILWDDLLQLEHSFKGTEVECKNQ